MRHSGFPLSLETIVYSTIYSVIIDRLKKAKGTVKTFFGKGCYEGHDFGGLSYIFIDES